MNIYYEYNQYRCEYLVFKATGPKEFEEIGHYDTRAEVFNIYPNVKYIGNR